MGISPKPTDHTKANPPTDEHKTTPAQEWGEGVETGKAIARSGDDKGHVPGATGDKKDSHSSKE